MRLITADTVRTARQVLGDSILVDRGLIVGVGRAADLQRSDQPEERFPGATIVPGLRDAHMHPVRYAGSLAAPSLKRAADFAAIADVLSDTDRALPAGASLVALRLDDESLAEARLPDRRFLDGVLPERPAMLLRYCDHVSVVNTAALRLAGIGVDTPDPPGGTIDRDAAGRPTGVLRETAMELAAHALRPLANPVTSDALVTATHGLAAVGLTEVGAIAGTDGGLWPGSGSEVGTIVAAAHRIAVEMQVFVVASSPKDLAEAAEALDGAGGRVGFAGVKIFSDGSLGGHTAAMHAGFTDRPDLTGIDRLDRRRARDLAQASLMMGGRVAVHAIGDRANTMVLDLMESLIAHGADPAMLRIEHASVLTTGDIARFGRLGVTASVQPAFIASETGWLEKRLGPERLARTYPFRSLADAGAPLAGGSDSPVEPPHPLWGMATARDRCGIVPEEGLLPVETLALFTSGAAAALGGEADLAAGAPATFTVLDVDPVTASPDELRGASVLGTWIEGSRVAVPPGTVAWRE